MNRFGRTGKVSLVGAGPGDPGLLTIRAVELLKEADCVIYDYLVNPEILNYVSSRAEKLYVGKIGCGKSCKQEDINALMIEKARQHRRIVRLKGGDPFVFGRGGEEAEALVDASIEWEVVPGVSAGTSVAAYAGIPVTHRGLSRSVAFVTGHEKKGQETSSIQWEHLSKGVETLVFFMGVAKIEEISSQLLKHGKQLSTPVAVIRWGTYQEQEVYVSDLKNVTKLVAQRQIKAPALIVVGEVVRLREKLNWFASSMRESIAA